MTDRVADVVLSALVLAAVVVLAALGVVNDELVVFTVGALLPSPTRETGAAITRRRAPPG